MRRKLIFGILAIGLLAGILFLAPPDDSQIANQLGRRMMDKEFAASGQINTIAEGPDWAALEASGTGMPVPESLSIDPFDGKGYWLIAKEGEVAAAKTPFAPGRFPVKTSHAQPSHENPGFLGAEACRQCHPNKMESFVHTAHYRTSRFASPNEIAGSFDEGSNVLRTRDPGVDFKMVRRGERSYQRARLFDWKFEVPFDITIGSGKLGESYLYWHRDQLFQSNASYVSKEDRWINSPGYVDGDATYDRTIRSRCVDCHFTYADYREPPNHYTPESFLMGVTCERCHGPGQDHVNHHQQHPEEKSAAFMSVPTQLSRKKQLQLCGQCHTTVTPITSSPFSFRPGDDLAQHYAAPDPSKEGDGVHSSNQLTRIAMSKCFEQSEMACAECHNLHQQERGDMALFSQRCLACHQVAQCGVEDHRLDSIDLAANCIDCHMPRRAGAKMKLETAQGSVFPPLRDHHIRIDRKATESHLNSTRLHSTEQP